MTRSMKKRSRKAGLPPGTPVHIGERRSESTRLTLLHYNEQHAVEHEIKTVDEAQALRNSPGISWINVTGLHDVEHLAQFGQAFGLHPLVLEDILNTDQRPKLEDYGDYLYIVIKRLGNGNQTWTTPPSTSIKWKVFASPAIGFSPPTLTSYRHPMRPQ